MSPEDLAGSSANPSGVSGSPGGRTRREIFWREVMGAYADLIDRSGRPVDRAAKARARKAGQYRLGTLPIEQDPDVPF